MTTAIQVPKKALEDILEAGRRFAAAEDALEDALLTSDPAFLKRMRHLRVAHLHGRVGSWRALKLKHGVQHKKLSKKSVSSRNHGISRRGEKGRRRRTWRKYAEED